MFERRLYHPIDGLLIGKEVNPDGSESLATEWIEPNSRVQCEMLVDAY